MAQENDSKLIFCNQADITLRHALDAAIVLSKKCNNINDLLVIKKIVNVLSEQIDNEVQNNLDNHDSINSAFNELTFNMEDLKGDYVDVNVAPVDPAYGDFINSIKETINELPAPLSAEYINKLNALNSHLNNAIAETNTNNANYREQISQILNNIDINSNQYAQELVEEYNELQQNGVKLNDNTKAAKKEKASVLSIFNPSSENVEPVKTSWKSNYDIAIGTVANESGEEEELPEMESFSLNVDESTPAVAGENVTIRISAEPAEHKSISADDIEVSVSEGVTVVSKDENAIVISAAEPGNYTITVSIQNIEPQEFNIEISAPEPQPVPVESFELNTEAENNTATVGKSIVYQITNVQPVNHDAYEITVDKDENVNVVIEDNTITISSSVAGEYEITIHVGAAQQTITVTFEEEVEPTTDYWYLGYANPTNNEISYDENELAYINDGIVPEHIDTNNISGTIAAKSWHVIAPNTTTINVDLWLENESPAVLWYVLIPAKYNIEIHQNGEDVTNNFFVTSSITIDNISYTQLRVSYYNQGNGLSVHALFDIKFV